MSFKVMNMLAGCANSLCSDTECCSCIVLASLPLTADGSVIEGHEPALKPKPCIPAGGANGLCLAKECCSCIVLASQLLLSAGESVIERS